ncbi:MAG: DNA-binding protein WhiA [Actinomycetaceae bacterium]|nr:DNA-binding protein WhiA [Actinomycetaceae bacterium]MDY6083199.1 DNA-binding protein WhiA [Actinomycetaceae bacterium]
MAALTSQVKDELAMIEPRMTSSLIAEVSTMFRFAGGLEIQGGRINLQAELAHAGSARHLFDMVTRLFHREPELLTVSSVLTKGANHYVVRIVHDGEHAARRIFLLDAHHRPIRGLAPAIVGGSKADAAAAWRGAFLARGSLMEPGRNSGLDVRAPSMEAAYALGGMARRMNIAYRTRQVKGSYRIDIRESDAVTDLLARMGAHKSLLAFEQLRVVRDVNSSVNRLANFDDANLRRSANAAVVAVMRAQRAFDILGEDVPDHLREAGEARIAHPEDTLGVLGQRLHPPISKDAVAGRLRRLYSLADKRAAERGIPPTSDVPDGGAPGHASAHA